MMELVCILVAMLVTISLSVISLTYIDLNNTVALIAVLNFFTIAMNGLSGALGYVVGKKAKGTSKQG